MGDIQTNPGQVPGWFSKPDTGSGLDRGSTHVFHLPPDVAHAHSSTDDRTENKRLLTRVIYLGDATGDQNKEETAEVG